MSIAIAVAGKGGTGKTTIAALLIKLLSQKGAVLAVDADPSANLNQALGLPLGETVGKIREDMGEDVKKGLLSPGIPKQDYLDLKINAALVESSGIDLLAIGRPEGPGCYCAANSMLRLSIDRLAQNYTYVVIDSEAGMEHISRQTTMGVDILIIVSDPTVRGITAAARTKELIAEMRQQVGRICLVVNRVAGDFPPQLQRLTDRDGLELTAVIREDPWLADLEIEGKPVTELPLDSPLQSGVKEFAEKIGLLGS